MFISTHDATIMVGDGIFSEVEVRLLDTDESGTQCLQREDGTVFYNTCEEALEPIQIECVYCSATLNQSERVECGCGLVISAISDEQANIMHSCIYGGQNPDFVLRFYTLNGIEWLEIQPGRESEQDD
jgi:hypothetical protein